MSILFLKSNGILETYVTWDDIQEDLLTIFGANARLGPNKKATELSDGRGFLSKVASIDPDWADPNHDLPSKFVVKILSTLTLAENAERRGETIPDEVQLRYEKLFKRLHNVEVSAYELISRLQNVPSLKYYCGKKFSNENQIKGYIIIEYVDSVSTIHAYTKFSDNEIVQALSWLAKFHSLSSQLNCDDLRQFSKDVLGDGFGLSLDKEEMKCNMPVFNDVLPNVDQSLLQTFAKYGEEMGDPDFMNFIDRTAENVGMPRVLCHGDPWAPNLLFTRKEEGLELKTIIDLQNSHVGCAGFDLARLLISMLSIEQYSDIEKYLTLYHEKCTKEFGKEMFSKSQIFEAYARFEPAMAFIYSFTICGLGRRCRRQKDLPNSEEVAQYCFKKAEYLISLCCEKFPPLRKAFNDRVNRRRINEALN